MGNHYDPRDEEDEPKKSIQQELDDEDLQAKADAAHADWCRENDKLKERPMDKCDEYDFRVPQRIAPGPTREPGDLRDRVGLMLRDRIVAARDWLRDRPQAVAGSGGNLHTYATACILLSFDLDVGVVTSLMSEWNEKNLPPWSESELLEIVRNADKYGTGKRHTYSGLNDLADKVGRDVTEDSVEKLKKLAAGGNIKPTNPKDAVGIRKPRFFSGMSAHVRRLVSIGMMEGAMKYGRHNYRPAAVRASVYYDATNEHLDSWWEGEDIDPDSKLNHVIKAICSLYVLADAIVTGNLVDDRPPRTRDVSEFKAELQPLIDELFRKYPDPKEAFTNLNSAVDSLVKPSEEK